MGWFIANYYHEAVGRVLMYLLRFDGCPFLGSFLLGEFIDNMYLPGDVSESEGVWHFCNMPSCLTLDPSPGCPGSWRVVEEGAGSFVCIGRKGS